MYTLICTRHTVANCSIRTASTTALVTSFLCGIPMSTLETNATLFEETILDAPSTEMPFSDDGDGKVKENEAGIGLSESQAQ